MEEKNTDPKTIQTNLGAANDDQHTDKDSNSITKANEEEELRIRKQRTHQASTKPDKNHIG